MNEQPNNNYPQQQPVPQGAPATPQAQQPQFTPAPDPRFYQPPAVPITSQTKKVPIWLIVLIGICFLAAVGLLVAVILVM